MISFRGKYDSTKLLFNNLGLLQFDYVKKYFLLLSTFRDIHNNDQSQRIFTVFHHSQATRGNNVDLAIPRVRTTLYKYSIHCTAPHCWNDLPNHLKQITNLVAFKTKLKTLLYSLQSQ